MISFPEMKSTIFSATMSISFCYDTTANEMSALSIALDEGCRMPEQECNERRAQDWDALSLALVLARKLPTFSTERRVCVTQNQ